MAGEVCHHKEVVFYPEEDHDADGAREANAQSRTSPVCVPGEKLPVAMASYLVYDVVLS
jgi:hypothetical protein